jgi:hypothetical protein
LSENKDIASTNTLDFNSKSNKFKIILLLSIIMAAIGIFAASYYSSINNVYGSYESTLINSINQVNEANKTIATFNSDQTIDVEYAKEKLPSIIEDLSNIKSALSNTPPTAKYKKDLDNLMLGLDKNKLVYMQVVGILNNPSGADVETAMANLKTYRNDCMNSYSLINVHNIKIALPETSLTFIDNVLNYSYSAVMIRKETDIKLQQNQEFVGKIDSLSKDFLDAKTNYYSYVMKVRKKEMSYDDLLTMVDGDLLKLSTIQTNFKKDFSIPSAGIPTYEAFKILLATHENYLRDFKLALNSEKVQVLSSVIDPVTLEALYVSSNLIFKEVDNYYNDFTKNNNELKAKL